jgi:glycogen debranching enzyme
MEPTNWKQGWRLWAPRSYAEAIDTRTGDRLVMRLAVRQLGVSFDRFGPNVGQPNQRPPLHPLHRDVPELASGLRLGCWTLDGCYELTLDRPEVRLHMVISDSRSLACGPSDDPIMRQGVLLAQIECTHLAENAELWFESTDADGGPLRRIILGGPARQNGERLCISEGLSQIAVGRIPDKVNQAKAQKRIRQMASYVQHYGANQLTGAQRMGHAVRWNTCWDPARQDVYLAVSRSWVQMMSQNLQLPEGKRGPLIFGWDSALSSLLVSRSEPQLARAIVHSVLSRQQDDGRMPPVSLGEHDSDRMAPPLLPLAVWYLCYDGRMEFAAEVLPQLMRAHRWMMQHREPHHDGLLCWGDTGGDKRGPIRIDGWVGAVYESGMDNSPMWEELGYDGATHSMGKACVDLTSMAALSARVLAVLAERTGQDPRPFYLDYRRIQSAVNTRLWGTDQLYHNLRVDGSLAERITPTSFYPMLAGLATREQAAALINRHLRSRETFFGHPTIPSVPRSSPYYDGDGDYWRGRIWPPMSYLCWAGLRQYNPAEAQAFAEHCRELFDEEWSRDGDVHENYSAVTGRGEAGTGVYARSCPMYCWGGLLLLPELEGTIGGAISRLPVITA